MIGSTGLPAYGHGDWNDSLQPVDPELAARLCSTWTVVLQAQALHTLGAELTEARPPAGWANGRTTMAHRGVDATCARALLVDGVLTGYGLFADEGDRAADPSARHVGPASVQPAADDPRDRRRPADAGGGPALGPDRADTCVGPDGARLFDRPVAYPGGPLQLFQRAEASTFFGREIGLMYMHAHLRYAEALARVGDGTGLLRALALAQPLGMTTGSLGAAAAVDLLLLLLRRRVRRPLPADEQYGDRRQQVPSKAAGASTPPARACSCSWWCSTCWAAGARRHGGDRPGARSRSDGLVGPGSAARRRRMRFAVGRSGYGVVAVRSAGPR